MILKPIVYVAGPYRSLTSLGVISNVYRAQAWCAAINRTGLVWAKCPHNLSEGMQNSLPEEEWLAYTLEESKRSEGLFMLPGWVDSSGSVGEQMAAELDGRPWVVGDRLDNVEVSVRALLALIEACR